MTKTPSEPPSQEDALAAYARLVEDFEQAVPILVAGAGENVAMSELTDLAPEPRDALSMYAEMVDRDMLPRPEWVLVSSEAYRRTVPSRDDVSKIRHGELAERYAQGELEIAESVIIHMWHCDGRNWTISRDFVRHSGGVDWAEEIAVMSPVGVIPELLSSIVTVP